MQETTNPTSGVTRRAFLRDAGVGAAGAVTFAALLNSTSTAHADEADGETESEAVVTQELAIPEAAAPDVTAYDCDVLVVGGGFAGLNAAMAAVEAGATTVMVDKGCPGYSGLSPWPSSHRWFDPDFGDDEDAFKECIMRGSEYVGNADWFQVWIDQSKETYERLEGWGLMDRFDRCADTEYWDTLDYQGYYDSNLSVDRHQRWMGVLEDGGVTVVPYTMIVDVEESDGRVVGAVGMHVPSGTVMTFNAKAVVLCTGGGCYKPVGYPVGGDTFDGEYIAYNLGLPIAGKEYDDFHTTCSAAPGNAFLNNSWDWLENIWLCGGDITADTVTSYATTKQKIMVLGRVTGTVDGLSPVDGTEIEDQMNATVTRRSGTASDDPDDPRIGKCVSPKLKGDCYGAAVGMHAHLSCGVFCGLDDLEGATSIEGLWVAGDGIYASNVTGATYPVGVGFTSSFCSIQGNIAGAAAAAYAAGAEAGELSQDFIDTTTAEIEAPLAVESGFSPDWARDQLQTIMAPYWVLVEKSEANLNAALTQVEYLRDNVVPKLQATNPHQQRLCLEVKHKVLSAEMKLRASLARTETRGLHYRSDYPYRDDENFLCYLTVTKGEDDSMVIEKVEVKDDWKGDMTEDYATRYPSRYPGEADALGLEEESSSSSWS